MDAIPAVVQGESDDNVIYAVIDANCGFCHRTYSSIANHFASGEFDNVEVRWIPVGFLGEDSKNKAFTLASLIEAQPQEAEVFLSKIMTRQTPSTPDGLIVKRDNVVAAEKLMREYGFSGVPFVLMRNGDNWKMNPGMPQKEFFTQNLITTQTDSLGN
jgi:protein-disulfide isomerase